MGNMCPQRREQVRQQPDGRPEESGKGGRLFPEGSDGKRTVDLLCMEPGRGRRFTAGENPDQPGGGQGRDAVGIRIPDHGRRKGKEPHRVGAMGRFLLRKPEQGPVLQGLQRGGKGRKEGLRQRGKGFRQRQKRYIYGTFFKEGTKEGQQRQRDAGGKGIAEIRQDRQAGGILLLRGGGDAGQPGKERLQGFVLRTGKQVREAPFRGFPVQPGGQRKPFAAERVKEQGGIGIPGDIPQVAEHRDTGTERNAGGEDAETACLSGKGAAGGNG